MALHGRDRVINTYKDHGVSLKPGFVGKTDADPGIITRALRVFFHCCCYRIATITFSDNQISLDDQIGKSWFVVEPVLLSDDRLVGPLHPKM